jgi:hypothetical protein
MTVCSLPISMRSLLVILVAPFMQRRDFNRSSSMSVAIVYLLYRARRGLTILFESGALDDSTFSSGDKQELEDRKRTA